jgi:hypothetical protein
VDAVRLFARLERKARPVRDTPKLHTLKRRNTCGATGGARDTPKLHALKRRITCGATGGTKAAGGWVGSLKLVFVTCDSTAPLKAGLTESNKTRRGGRPAPESVANGKAGRPPNRGLWLWDTVVWFAVTIFDCSL